MMLGFVPHPNVPGLAWGAMARGQRLAQGYPGSMRVLAIPKNTHCVALVHPVIPAFAGMTSR